MYQGVYTGVSRSGPHVCSREYVAIVRGSAAKRLIVNRSALAHASVRAGSASGRAANARRVANGPRPGLYEALVGDFHGDFSGISGHNSHETVSTYELGRARAWAERLRVRRVVRMYAQHRSMRPSTLAVARWPGRRSRWSACTVATAPFGAPAASARRLACPHSRSAVNYFATWAEGGGVVLSPHPWAPCRAAWRVRCRPP